MRDTDFETQLHGRLPLAEQEKHPAIELAETKAPGTPQKAAVAKGSEIQARKAKLADQSRKLEANVASEPRWIELLGRASRTENGRSSVPPS